MFCTSCGASNPEDARFCNQCGVALGAEGDGKPPTLSGVGAEKRAASAQGRVGSQQGGASLDGVALPMNGLPRGRVLGIAAGTGVLCLALGAAIAYRAPEEAPHVVPVTPVGLLGEPAAVVPVQPSERGATPTRRPNAGTRAPTTPPRAPGSTAGSAPGNTAGSAPGNTAGSAPGNTAGNTPENTAGSAPGNTAGNTPESTAGSAPASNGGTPAAPAENGVIERGPRVSSGGYHLGEETDATGTMDPRVFSFVYNQKRAQISACYSTASRARSVSGIIVLRVRINTQGRVASTRVISDSARVPELTQCVQTAVRSWAYPQPEGGDVEVDYPMRFGSSS